MKLLKRLPVAALALTLGAAYPAAAEAGGISIHIGGGHDHYYAQQHRYQRHGHHHRHKHYKQRYRYRQQRHHGHHHGQRKRHHYGYRSGYGRHCKPVHKYVTDEYGYTVKIGGTLCYDSYGRGYVVPGSRFVISRY